MSDENYDDIFAKGAATPAPQVEASEDEFTLDLSDAADFGSEYPVMPRGTYARVTVYNAEQKLSRAGNNMYVLTLAVEDEEKWGKNRKLRVFLTLSTKALRFSLPMLAALQAPMQVFSVNRATGQPTGTIQRTGVASVKEAKDLSSGLDASEMLRFAPPPAHMLEGKTAVAKMGEPRQDDNDDEKFWDSVDTLVSATDPKAVAYLSGNATAASQSRPDYSA